MFTSVCYHPSESQLITAGTNKKIAYWEAYDGQIIREIEAGELGSINTVDVGEDGNYFVTGGSDKLIKVKSLKIMLIVVSMCAVVSVMELQHGRSDYDVVCSHGRH